MNYGLVIDTVFKEILVEPSQGHVANYIPELLKVNPDCFGVALTLIDNTSYTIGDAEIKFSIQSIAKVFSLALGYETLGDKIWERVGVEPSGTAFNSLLQLEADHGKPRNPFINSGALVICDILLSQIKDVKSELLTFIRHISDNQSIDYSPNIALSEKLSGFRNIALCNFIKSFGNIHNHPEDVLDLYFNLCSIEMTCSELSKSFLFLANDGKKTTDQSTILTSSQTKRINAVMQTCGFYDESGEFTFKVGLPGKSGVGGGILAIHPKLYSIVTWSPRLNEKGNSEKGMKFLELFTTQTKYSIF
jgi:glutaminase